MTKRMKKLLYILFLLPTLLLAQQNLPLSREWGLDYDKLKNETPQKFQKSDTVTTNRVTVVNIKYTIEDKPCFKPYIVPSIHKEQDKSKSLLYRKIKKEDLLIVNDTADK